MGQCRRRTPVSRGTASLDWVSQGLDSLDWVSLDWVSLDWVSQGLDSLGQDSLGPDFLEPESLEPECPEPDSRGRSWPGQLHRSQSRQRLARLRRCQVGFHPDLVRFRLALVQFGLGLLPCRLELSPVGRVRFHRVR